MTNLKPFRSPGVRAPEPRDAIAASGEDAIPVRTESGEAQRFWMPKRREPAAPIPEAPHDRLMILRRREQPSAVPGKFGPPYAIVVLERFEDFSPADGIPNPCHAV
jgi:hypothetical protein